MPTNSDSLIQSAEHVARKVTWLEYAAAKTEIRQPRKIHLKASQNLQRALDLAIMHNKQHPSHTLDHEPHPPSPADSETDNPLFTLPSNIKPIVVTVQVNQTDLMMELDTGASLSIISETTYSSLSHALPPLSPAQVTLSTYTGEKITPVGTVDIKVIYQMQNVTLPLVVILGNGPSLMGHNWLEHIKLNWSEINIVNFCVEAHYTTALIMCSRLNVAFQNNLQ